MHILYIYSYLHSSLFQTIQILGFSYRLYFLFRILYNQFTSSWRCLFCKNTLQCIPSSPAEFDKPVKWFKSNSLYATIILLKWIILIIFIVKPYCASETKRCKGSIWIHVFENQQSGIMLNSHRYCYSINTLSELLISFLLLGRVFPSLLTIFQYFPEVIYFHDTVVFITTDNNSTILLPSLIW